MGPRVDTRRSHGCYIIVLAGRCIAYRSKAHKWVMLSSAAAEYYEASEGCRELIYIRAIIEDFRDNHCPIRMCHLTECCDEGIVELRHIGPKYQAHWGLSISWQILEPRCCLRLCSFLCKMSS